LLTVRDLCTAPHGVLTQLGWPGEANSRPRDLTTRWLADDNKALRDLARARIALETSPYVAEALVSNARALLHKNKDCRQFTAHIQLCFLSDHPAHQVAR
jgi:hypothetical protein